VPPFVVVATAGFVTITGPRSARLAIHEIQNIIGFFRPLLYYISLKCTGGDICVPPDYQAQNGVDTEYIADVRFRPFDCVGLEILPPGYPTIGSDPSLGPAYVATPYAHPIGTNIADRHCVMATDIGGEPVRSGDELVDDNSWTVKFARCTAGVGNVSVTASVTLAGKDGVNGTIHAAAPDYSETINVPLQHSGITSDPECHDGAAGVSRLDFTQYIDVRTQSLIDSGCCVTPAGIHVVVTVTDAVGTVAFLTIPVV
jgi:hypothetical protein